MYCTTTEQKRARVRRAWRCAESGGTMRMFARQEGISQARVSAWVRDYPDLRDRFLSNPYQHALPEDVVDRRARLMAEFRAGLRKLREIAELEGVTPAAMHYWAKRHEDEVWEASLGLDRRAA